MELGGGRDGKRGMGRRWAACRGAHGGAQAWHQPVAPSIPVSHQPPTLYPLPMDPPLHPASPDQPVHAHTLAIRAEIPGRGWFLTQALEHRGRVLPCKDAITNPLPRLGTRSAALGLRQGRVTPVHGAGSNCPVCGRARRSPLFSRKPRGGLERSARGREWGVSSSLTWVKPFPNCDLGLRITREAKAARHRDPAAWRRLIIRVRNGSAKNSCLRSAQPQPGARGCSRWLCLGPCLEAGGGGHS